MQQPRKTITTVKESEVSPLVDLYLDGTLVCIGGNWDWDLNCDYIFCSDVITALQQHYPGTKGIIHPDDVAYVKQQTAMLKNDAADLQFRIITTYGEVKKLSGVNCFLSEVNELRISDPQKEVINKITHERELEKIRQSFHHTKQITNHAEIITKTGTWYINSVTLDTVYSDNVFRIHGIPPQSLNPHPHTFDVFIHADDRAEVTDAFDKALRDKVPLHLEYRIVINDDQEKFLTLITHWAHNLNGEDVLNGLVIDHSESVFGFTKLEETEHKLAFYKNILQQNEKVGNTGFWYMNLLTRQTYYSDNFYRIYGLRPQSVPGRPAQFINYVHPDDLEKVSESIVHIRSHHAPPDIEYRIIRSDRKLRHIQQKGQLISYAGNELIMICTIQDITAEVQNERLLKELNENSSIKTFVQKQSEEMAKISSWMWEPGTSNYIWSDNIYELLGFKKSVKELTEMQLLKSVLPEDRKKFSDEFSFVVEKMGDRDFNFRILKAGEVRNMKASFKLMDYSGRKFFIGTMQDITDSILTEQQLNENLTLNQLLSENILDRVFITDLHNNIILWSKKCEQFFRLKADQVMGRNYFDVFPGQKNEKVIKRFNEVLKGESVYQPAEKSSGKKYHDLHMIPIKHSGNNMFGILHVMHDVTRELQLNNALNERLTFIESLLQETLDRIIVLDKNLNFTYWNQQAERHYHINREYIISKNLLEVFPLLVKKSFYDELKNTIKDNTIHIVSGADVLDENLLAETYLIPLQNDLKENTGILWIAHDITRIKQAENELKQNEELLQSVFNSSFDAVIMLKAVRNARGEIEDFEWMLENTKAMTYSGKSMIGKKYAEEYPWVKESGILEQYKKVVEDNIIADFEQPFYADGIEGLYHIVAVKLGDGLVATAEDISQRRKAELELKGSRELLAKQNKIYEYAEQIANLGTWAWDPATDKAHYSDNMFRLFGMEPQEVEPNFDTIPKFIHPEDREYVLESAKHLKKGNSTVIEYRVIRRDGEIRKFRNCTQIINYNNEEYVIGTTQDITEMYEKDINQKALELLNKKKDEFISIASHELKTPVTNIKASLQILHEIIGETAGNNLTHLLERSVKQANKLAELVNDLLDATVIAEGKIRLTKTTFNITDAIRECGEEICSEEKDCHIKIEDNTLIEVTADKVRIQQVITNFITNAIKYSPSNKSAVIKIKEGNGDVIVSVVDKGIGIPRDKLNNVFDRYFRVDDVAGKFTGLGLGLFISKEIIRIHGGTVGVKSTEGKGSTFWFRLPLLN